MSKPELDLEAVLAIVADYERRKAAAREFETEHFGGTTEERVCYLASLKQGEAAKAFEVLRPLVERVQELERQRMLFVRFIENERVPYCVGCPAFDDPCRRPETSYRRSRQECIQNLIQWAERAGKEIEE